MFFFALRPEHNMITAKSLIFDSVAVKTHGCSAGSKIFLILIILFKETIKKVKNDIAVR